MGFVPENNFAEGEALEYIGSGFMGFDPDTRTVYYVMNDDASYLYVWVKYKGSYKRLHVNELRRVNYRAA